MGLLLILKEIFRPPVLVFFVTITALAVTLFAFSLSMEINKDKILNPDIKGWNIFYKSVSSLRICMPKKSERPKRFSLQSERDFIEDNTSLKNNTSVSFLAEATFAVNDITQDNYLIKATIEAEDLGFLKSDDKIDLTASYEKAKKKGSKMNRFACITVEGPPSLLPSGKMLLSECSHPKKQLQESTFMTLEKVKDESFCPSALIGQLSLKEKESLNVYLSESDTRLIQMHIFVTSFVLCAMILLFFIYSLIGKFCRNEKRYPSDSDMVPLES